MAGAGDKNSSFKLSKYIFNIKQTQLQNNVNCVTLIFFNNVSNTCDVIAKCTFKCFVDVFRALLT